MSAPGSPATDENRTALINQIRGPGLEYGIALPEGAHKIMACLPDYLEDAENELTTLSRQLFHGKLQERQSSQQWVNGRICHYLSRV